MTPKPIVIIQGGQWGSEAKGAVAAAICLQRNIDIAVRTGAINAGHTVVYNGTAYAMQQIPTGWVNPHTSLFIGAGAYIHPPTLFREIEMINAAMPEMDVRDRLYIDYRCGVHDEAAEDASKSANRHHSIGATGKGCSEAIVNKIRNRNNGAVLFREWCKHEVLRNGGTHIPVGLVFTDTCDLLNSNYDAGKSILIEGTQGTFLDLHLGPYPFTTSRMTSAANWVAECGLSPALEYEVVLVCRTYPIRVAGNSGPMPGEIEWTELANWVNEKRGIPLVDPRALGEFQINLQLAASKATLDGRYKVPTINRQFDTDLSQWTPEQRSEFRVAASELHRDALNMCSPEAVKELRKLFEMTTVTKKLRRVAEMDISMLKEAVAINRPAWIAITFLDYVFPRLANMTAGDVDGSAVQGDVKFEPLRWVKQGAATYINGISSALGVPVKWVSTGPKPENFWSTDNLKATEQ